MSSRRAGAASPPSGLGRLDERLLDRRHEPGRIGGRGPAAAAGRRSKAGSRPGAGRPATRPTRSAPRAPTTPAITAGDRGRVELRDRRGRRDRGQEQHLEQQARDRAADAGPGAETELTHAYEGAPGLRLVASPSRDRLGGRPGPPRRRTSACRASIRSDSSRTTRPSGRRPASAACSSSGAGASPCGRASRPRSRRLPVVGHRVDRLARLRVDPRATFVERLVGSAAARRLRRRRLAAALGELAAELLGRIAAVIPAARLRRRARRLLAGAGLRRARGSGRGRRCRRGRRTRRVRASRTMVSRLGEAVAAAPPPGLERHGLARRRLACQVPCAAASCLSSPGPFPVRACR